MAALVLGFVLLFLLLERLPDRSESAAQRGSLSGLGTLPTAPPWIEVRSRARWQPVRPMAFTWPRGDTTSKRQPTERLKWPDVPLGAFRRHVTLGVSAAALPSTIRIDIYRNDPSEATDPEPRWTDECRPGVTCTVRARRSGRVEVVVPTVRIRSGEYVVLSAFFVGHTVSGPAVGSVSWGLRDR